MSVGAHDETNRIDGQQQRQADELAIELLGLVNALPVAHAEQLVGADVLDRLLATGRACATDDSEFLVGAVASANSVPSNTSATRLRSMRTRVADVLVSTPLGPVPPDVAISCASLLMSVDRQVTELSIRACRSALLLGDPDTAVDIARHGLDHEPGHVELTHLLAMAHESTGQHGAAAAASGGNVPDDAAWLGRWASNLFFSTGLAMSRHDVADDHNEIVANRAWIEALEGDVNVVASTVGEILNDARSSPQAVVWACVAGAVPAALDGRERVADRLVDHADSIVRHHAERLSPFARMQVDVVRFLAGVRLGRLDAMEALASQQLANAGSPFFGAIWAAFGGIIGRETGGYADAAASLTSRQIASALELSIRTVDNQLGRVYAKTGVASRATLISVLRS